MTDHSDDLDEAPDHLGPPDWVWRIGGAAVILALLVVAAAAIISATTLVDRFAVVTKSSARGECIDEIRDTRRNVLDALNAELDLDRTAHDVILGDYLLSRVPGILPVEPTIEELAARYATNNSELDDDVELADRLLPKLPTVEELTAAGGTLPVIHPDRSVTERHFEACPAV